VHKHKSIEAEFESRRSDTALSRQPSDNVVGLNAWILSNPFVDRIDEIIFTARLDHDSPDRLNKSHAFIV
jgi:hypothetical protein